MSESWTHKEFVELLEHLSGSNLGDWDRTFVDDMVARHVEDGHLLLARMTPRQIEQLERMERQYPMTKVVSITRAKPASASAPAPAQPRRRGPEDETESANAFLGGNSVKILADHIQQAENLLSERDALNETLRDIVGKVKDLGILPVVFRKVLQRRRMDEAKRVLQDDQLSTCEELLKKYL